MSRYMYDLAGADARLRFSPFCWRVTLALVHKGLEFERLAWRFTEKDRLAFTGQEPESSRKVPVLLDTDGTAVSDSLAIFDYLDRTYPGAPLIGDGPARGRFMFVRHWSETALAPAILKTVAKDLFDLLDPADQPYFRESREARLGCTIEAFQDRDAGLKQLGQALAPVRALLGEAAFIDGERPGGADYLVFSMLMWGQATSRVDLLSEDQVVADWFARLRQWAEDAGVSCDLARELGAHPSEH
ncbi:glutathione S-transferase N-terminal domain-containing protein [Larsenimonas salina]|uniref:glutathione S-transferase N-terminal domain-containing protein n=1 Tax=Larsenimonas salina TaxID=1295565 RepID=UPI0020738C7B|nr:glutathione S-transferase N-terminal domain-containing protein [Larsenimonas salina]MCM5705410.1 glutathione S-transferase N-terminal domain-containing protein [Larsenimonas salina]